MSDVPGSMPKGRIALPPKPEPPKPVERPFIVPPRPTSVDERVFDAPEGDFALIDVQNAIKSLRIACQNAQQGAAALHEDEMRTVAARHHAAFEHSIRVTKAALMTSDTARARLLGQIDALKAKVSAPAGVIRDALASEIRTAIRGLKPGERTKTVLGAARDGDDTIAAAVLNGPAMLSGLSAAEQSHIRATWGATRYPDDVKRISELEKALGHLDRAASLTLKYSFSVADRAIIDRATATAKRAAEAVAETNRPPLH